MGGEGRRMEEKGWNCPDMGVIYGRRSYISFIPHAKIYFMVNSIKY